MLHFRKSVCFVIETYHLNIYAIELMIESGSYYFCVILGAETEAWTNQGSNSRRDTGLKFLRIV